jgi:hypothetical protein
MKRSLLIATFLLFMCLGACRGAKPAPRLALTPGNGTPPSPFYQCDGITGACNVLGIPGNPTSVNVVGGALAIDGGTSVTGTVSILSDAGQQVTAILSGVPPVAMQSDAGQQVTVIGAGAAGAPAGGVTTVQGVSGGTPLSSDPTAGELANSFVVSNIAAAGAAMITDAGNQTTVNFQEVDFYNTTTALAYWQLFCPQGAALDAGGINAAGTVPSLSIPCPAGNILCSYRLPQSLTGPCAWYASWNQANLFVDAGAPTLSVQVQRR